MYRVTTKDGRVYRASKVETAMGFVEMECWDCERRLPSGEIAEIRTVGAKRLLNVIAFLLVVYIIVFLFGVAVF